MPTLSPTYSKYEIRDGVEYRNGAEICLQGTAAGDREYKHRLDVMNERQYGLCAICGLWMSDPTFDHESPRTSGNRNDTLMHEDGRFRNAAVDERCNTQKGSKRYGWTFDNALYLPLKYLTADFRPTQEYHLLTNFI